MENVAVVIFVVVVVAAVVYAYQKDERRRAALAAAVPPEERAEKAATAEHGLKNTAMVCPHCQTRGEVRTRQVTMKKGVSGGKAAAAVMTAGVSTFAVGLSRKESLTAAWCGICRNSWVF